MDAQNLPEFGENYVDSNDVNDFYKSFYKSLTGVSTSTIYERDHFSDLFNKSLKCAK